MGRPHPASNIVSLHALPSAAYDPMLSIDQRHSALVSALPETLQAIVGRGMRHACFDDVGGFVGMRETWSPPAAVDPAVAEAATRALAAIEHEILAPVDPAWLLARLLALFAHCPPRSTPLDPAVERMVASDWAEDLGEYPQWAVDQAVRVWRRTKKWRPTIMEMRSLCDEAVATERTLAERLRQIAAVKPRGAGREGGGTFEPWQGGRSGGCRSKGCWSRLWIFHNMETTNQARSATSQRSSTPVVQFQILPDPVSCRHCTNDR
ncbi:hypothetical protein [Azospirillum argentinense]|nr:hypothetical protein [Azospirillum argentinense]